MNNIRVLDCTLRDGGYCNKWEFGKNNIRNIIEALCKSDIDIIECGYLSYSASENENKTIYPSIDAVNNIIDEFDVNRLFAVMINYGEYPIEKIPSYAGHGIEGIRVAFHKKNISDALDYCRQLNMKGYKVFVQPMVSLNYTDKEFVELIEEVNIIKPYAFYIVDSFGNMRNGDLTRLYNYAYKNLSENVIIGFHSHNNLQMAYSNATIVVNQNGPSRIIDSSIYGMGRGAGNLNTELLIEYLNVQYGTRYVLYPLLDVMEKIVDVFYKNNSWGYSIPNYLAAKNNSHPNYAEFLNNKKTLTVKDMENIFQLMDPDRKNSYDEKYIEEIYLNYMSKENESEKDRAEIVRLFKGKRIILIAPGKSAKEEKSKIVEKADETNTITISINHLYDEINVDYVFISNIRRYRELGKEERIKKIVTSNIVAEGECIRINYLDLLSDVEGVEDNAGLMAINFLKQLEVDKVFLAGFDGYSHLISDNYANEEMTLALNKNVMDNLNKGVSSAIGKISREMNVEFLTTPRYINCK